MSQNLIFMKKSNFLILTIFFLLNTGFAQQTLSKQAIIIKFTTGFKVGDTVEITRSGRAYSSENQVYTYQFSAPDRFGTQITFSEKKVDIISPAFSFWKEAWFWDRSFPEGAAPLTNQVGILNTKRLLRELAAQDLLLQDNLLEDYLLKLLDEIFGAEEAAFFPIRPYPKVLKAQTPFAAGLHDGCIVVSTGLLASVYSESELLAVLTAQVGHFLLGHTAVNAQKYSLADDFIENLFSEDLLTFSTSSWLQYHAKPLSPSYQLAGELRATMGDYALAALQGIGATYDNAQLSEVDLLVQRWLHAHRKDPEAIGFLLDRQRRNFFFPAPENSQNSAASVPYNNFSNTPNYLITRLENLEFNAEHTEKVDTPDPELDEILAEVLAFHAWHEYYLKRYPRSLSAASRLIQTEIADAKMYLLYARLLRTMYPSGEYDQGAITLLAEGRKRMVQKLPELLEEEVLLLMRMKDWNEANKALSRLDYMLLEMYEDEAIVAKKEWSKRMRRRVKLAEKNG
jgi:hypothetical protein